MAKSTPQAENAGHILVVDDDREIRDLLGRFLGKHGYRVTTVADGLSLCRGLQTTSRIPIIMLTMAGEETDRITGLETGAEDYLLKPVRPRELLARIKAVPRRAPVVAAAGKLAARALA